ncbi:MAG: transglutaminase domain-containing protein, partial [Aquificaceae bacterium]|nr:transglutaminase domain-containing protein [Aquificaceae bacterium]
CEYYASATALLLRLMGVPARVVGGFKGALYNPYGKYHVVTNSMAHVWVEAYVKGEWIRVDTTPSYSPEAIREISKFSLLHDYIVSFWHTNVIGFDAKRQISLFRGIKEGLSRKSSFESVSSIFEPLMLMLLGMSGFYFLLQAYFKSRKTPENLYRELKWFLKSKGLISDEFLPEHVLTRVLESPYYDGSLYIIRLYQRKRFSQHKVYKNEIIEGYKILQNLKNIAGRS